MSQSTKGYLPLSVSTPITPTIGRIGAWIEERGAGSAESDLQALEAELSVALPADYRAFLATINGGMLPTNTIRIPGAMWMPTSVYVFFGLGRCLDTSDLRWNRQTFVRQCIDETLLPIGCDAGGSPFCMVVRGDARGAIVYIDLDQPQTRHPVAPTFSAFLATIDFGEVETDRPARSA